MFQAKISAPKNEEQALAAFLEKLDGRGYRISSTPWKGELTAIIKDIPTEAEAREIIALVENGQAGRNVSAGLVGEPEPTQSSAKPEGKA